MTTTALNEILPAVVAAMGAVRKLGKGERNKHDGYNFASIDDFLALVNPICADHGLVVVSEQDAIEDFTRQGRTGENAWMRVTFRFTVYHTSGQNLPPVVRTVEVLRNGAQAYGSAQSYCLKQFLRGLFLIATGDKDDADYQRTDDGPVSRGAPLPPRETRQEPPARRTDDEVGALRGKMLTAEVPEAAILGAYKVGDLRDLTPADYASAMRRLDANIATKAKAEAPKEPALLDDKIPY